MDILTRTKTCDSLEVEEVSMFRDRRARLNDGPDLTSSAMRLGRAE